MPGAGGGTQVETEVSRAWPSLAPEGTQRRAGPSLCAKVLCVHVAWAPSWAHSGWFFSGVQVSLPRSSIPSQAWHLPALMVGAV